MLCEVKMKSVPKHLGLEIAFHSSSLEGFMPLLTAYRLATFWVGLRWGLPQDHLINDRHLRDGAELSCSGEEVHILQNAPQW